MASLVICDGQFDKYGILVSGCDDLLLSLSDIPCAQYWYPPPHKDSHTFFAIAYKYSISRPTSSWPHLRDGFATSSAHSKQPIKTLCLKSSVGLVCSKLCNTSSILIESHVDLYVSHEDTLLAEVFQLCLFTLIQYTIRYTILIAKRKYQNDVNIFWETSETPSIIHHLVDRMLFHLFVLRTKTNEGSHVSRRCYIMLNK